MKIAIDGRVLNDAAGKAVYTRSVLIAWRSCTEHQFHVYGYQPKDGENWPANWTFTPIASGSERLRVFRHLTEDALFSPSSYLTTALSNKPTLTTIHDLVIYKVPVKLPLKTIIAEKFQLKKAIKRSAALTVQTKSVEADLIDLFPIAKTKTHVVAPGVSPSIDRSALPSTDRQQKILNELKISGEYLLNVGTIEPRKNAVRLIQAYQQLPSELKDRYQLVLAGKIGWVDRPLRQLVDNPPTGVIFTGRLEAERLATLYSHATAVAYPSLYEGVGYPILEGYYWQRPVLTSDVSSTGEVGRGATLLVDPQSVEQIRAGLERLLTDNDLCTKLVAAGTTKLADYSWDRAAQTYLEILKQIS